MDASAPIPAPLDDDDEDVYLALSTAGTLWARGERDDALRWLRRAAETASDVDADARALELFKAAAEVASKISASAAPPAASTPPPPTAASPSPPPSPSVAAPPPLPPSAAARPVTQSVPPPADAPKAAPPKAPPPLPGRAQPVNITPQPLPGGRRATRGGAARMSAVPPQVASARAAVAPPPAGAARPGQPSARPQIRARTPEAGMPIPVQPRQAPPMPPGYEGGQQGRSSQAPPMPPGYEGGQQGRSSQVPPMPPGYEGGQQGRSSQVPMPPMTARSGAPLMPEVGPRVAAAAQASSARQQAAMRGAQAPGQPQPRGRGRLTDRRAQAQDDEVTEQRPLPDLIATSDDLDEKTAIIQGSGAVDAALRRVQEQEPTQAPDRARPSPRQDAPQDGEGAPAVASAVYDLSDGDTSDGPTNAGPTRAQAALAALAAPAAAPSGVAAPGPQSAGSPFVTSVRVAVVSAPSGLARIVALGPQDQAPAGSVVAILVPIREGDSAELAKLLGVSR